MTMHLSPHKAFSFNNGSALIVLLVIISFLTVGAIAATRSASSQLEQLKIEIVEGNVNTIIDGISRYYLASCHIGSVSLDDISDVYMQPLRKQDGEYNYSARVDLVNGRATMQVTVDVDKQNKVSVVEKGIFIQGATSRVINSSVIFTSVIGQSSTQNRNAWEGRLFVQENNQCQV